MTATLSPIASQFLAALRRLHEHFQPHPCGGFCADDIEHAANLWFVEDEARWTAFDELQAAGLITLAGFTTARAEPCYQIA